VSQTFKIDFRIPVVVNAGAVKNILNWYYVKNGEPQRVDKATEIISESEGKK
jgi:hypothetical protein